MGSEERNFIRREDVPGESDGRPELLNRRNPLKYLLWKITREDLYYLTL